MVKKRADRQNNEVRMHPLFCAAMRGESKATHKLLTEVSDFTRHVVRAKLSNEEDAEEVAQEVLISVHKALASYDPARACMPWLAAIIYYRTTDFLRKKYRVTADQIFGMEEIENNLQFSVTESPLEYEYLDKAVSQLSTGQQKVINLMYGRDHSVAETGEALEMSASAVKVTAHRAYKKLRGILESS